MLTPYSKFLTTKFRALIGRKVLDCTALLSQEMVLVKLNSSLETFSRKILYLALTKQYVMCGNFFTYFTLEILNIVAETTSLIISYEIYPESWLANAKSRGVSMTVRMIGMPSALDSMWCIHTRHRVVLSLHVVNFYKLSPNTDSPKKSWRTRPTRNNFFLKLYTDLILNISWKVYTHLPSNWRQEIQGCSWRPLQNTCKSWENSGRKQHTHTETSM